MKIIIGSDHRGYDLKEAIKSYFSAKHSMVDVGGYSKDRVEYPSVALNLAKALKEDLVNNLGIIICGSGIGVCIAVNKFHFIRGALLYNKAVATTAKQHNNANVICLGADHISQKDAIEYIEDFLIAKFEEGRHLDRIKALEDLAKT